jgi:hypothetical protein
MATDIRAFLAGLFNRGGSCRESNTLSVPQEKQPMYPRSTTGDEGAAAETGCSPTAPMQPPARPEPALLTSAGADPGNGPAPEASTDAPEPIPGLFEGWTLRPDAGGRLGWEAPDLPEVDRVTFDDLPGPAAVCAGVHPCPWCGRRSWWRSIYGVVVCGWCHPPAAPELVAEWLDGAETGLAQEPAPGRPRCCVLSGAVDA